MFTGSSFLALASTAGLTGATLLLVSGTSELDTSNLRTPGARATESVGGTNGTGTDVVGSLPSCSAERFDCGGVCVDLLTDGENCGQCGTLCAPLEVCSGGACSPACSDLTPETCGQAATSPANNATTSSTSGGVGGATATSTSGGVTTNGSSTGGLDTGSTGGLDSSSTGGLDTGSTGGLDASTTGGASAVAFALVAGIVDFNCAASICHGSRERPSLVDAASLYGTLMSATVRQCAGNVLVSPGDPAGSSLLMLVNHQCGNFAMPEGCQTAPCISQDDIATLTAWIEAGAPSN